MPISTRAASPARTGDRRRASPPAKSDDWEPAVALDNRGVAWISWDSYHTGNYDVFLRSFDGKKLGDRSP